MKRLGSVLAGVFSVTVVIAVLFGVTLIGVALIGAGCSDDGSPTGGGTTEGTVAVRLIVSDAICPNSFPADTLTDRVTAKCFFVPVHGGPALEVNFRSPGETIVAAQPGEYEVRVRSRRYDSTVIVPGVLVVSVDATPVIQGQAAPGAIPSMRIVDGTLNLWSPVSVYDPDTAMISFRYWNDEERPDVEAEFELINRLNNATGRHFDIEHMRREIVDYSPYDFMFYTVGYTFSVDDGVYLTDLIEKCRSYMTTHSDLFPRGTMAIDANSLDPCMF